MFTNVGKLSNQELLVSLLNLPQELANRILKRFETIQALRNATIDELMSIDGMEKQLAIKILTAIELSRRLMSKEMKQRITIRTPLDAERYMLSAEGTNGLCILFMNSKNQILHQSFGNSMTVATVDIFHLAVKHRARAILCIHRYPNEQSGASADDLALLERIEQSANLLDIRFVDYLILGGDSWISLKEKGYL